MVYFRARLFLAKPSSQRDVNRMRQRIVDYSFFPETAAVPVECALTFFPMP